MRHRPIDLLKTLQFLFQHKGRNLKCLILETALCEIIKFVESQMASRSRGLPDNNFFHKTDQF